MSSGFFSFFAHTGFLSVLVEEGFLPTHLSGSSAGALVGGAYAAGVDPPALEDALLQLERSHFFDPRPGLGILRGHAFRKKLEEVVPIDTFEACARPVAISVFDVFTRKTVVLTAGDLRAAIQASCAVPVLFHPTWIGGRPYLDGGILDRPGLAGMPSGERVLFHHIASVSPWRRKGSEGTKIPARDGMMTLSIDGLPRSGPFRLGEGRRALRIAREKTREALDRPFTGRVLVV